MAPHRICIHRPPLRLLVVGCGDVGRRMVRLLSAPGAGPRVHVAALTTSDDSARRLRSLGIVPLRGDLDEPATLGRLGAWPDRVVYLAPPPSVGDGDPRLLGLLRALARGGTARRLVYVSTSGVYGDCAGARVAETAPCRPRTARARRRVEAERLVRAWGRATGVPTAILRAPGIYGPERERGDPRDRLRRGDPALVPAEDVHTNHVHADDLARACLRALFARRARGGRAYNIADDTAGPMGDYLDDLADRSGLPRPVRITRAQLPDHFSPMQMTFLQESRRLDNGRARRELGRWMRHATVAQGLGLPERAPMSGG